MLKNYEIVDAVVTTVISDFKAVFFKCADLGYISVTKESMCFTYSLNSKNFRSWLHYVIRELGHRVSSSVLDSCIDEMYSLAEICRDSRQVYNRIAKFGTKTVIDLGSPSFEVLVLSPEGYKIEATCPVHFTRGARQLPLPKPLPTSNEEFIRLFKNLCTFENDNMWVVVLAVLLKFLHRDNGAYPILTFDGRQGSGKSRLTKVFSLLIDPCRPALSSPPKDAEGLFILSNSSYLIAIDNTSGFSNEMADILCRASTGGGITRRELYTNDGIRVYDIQVPIIINGIDEPSSRADLAERMIAVELKPIEQKDRRSEMALDEEFLEQYPRLLGGLYSIFCQCLKILPTVQTQDLPRMTELARMGIALEHVLNLSPGHFLKTYNSTCVDKNEVAFWNDSVCSWIHGRLTGSESTWKKKSGPISGTASELLKDISKAHRGSGFRMKSPRALGEHLRRIEPLLERYGITLEFIRTGSRREILIQGNPILLGSSDKNLPTDFDADEEYDL